MPDDCSRLPSRSTFTFPQGCSKRTRSGENIISWVASFLQSYNNIYNIAIFLVAFVKLASDFNLNIYHLASYWIVPEKKKTGGGGHIFLETPLEFLGFLLFPWKFETKQGFTPRNPTKLRNTPLRNVKA